MDFWKLFFRFIPIYKWRVLAYIVLNILCCVCSIFSFATIIPLLQILFGLSGPSISYIEWSSINSVSSALDVLKNDILYFLQEKIIVNGNEFALLLLGAFLMATSFLSNAFSLLAYFTRIPIRTGIARDLRKVVYGKIVRMPLSVFEGQSKGDFVSRMTNDVDEVDFGIGTALDMLIKDPVQIIVYIVTLFGISYVLTWKALILLVAGCIVSGIIGSAMKKYAMQVQSYKGQIVATFEETIAILPVIKAFAKEHYWEEKFATLNNKMRKRANTTNQRYSFAWPLADFLMTTIIAILLWFGGSKVLACNSDTAIGAAEFIYFLIVFYSIIPPIRDITKCMYGIRKAMASVERMNKVAKLDDEYENYGITAPVQLNAQVGQPLFQLNNISFSYGKRNVFKDLNLCINRGESVAIIGGNGSGKSTLVSLLMKLYPILSGEILIDNKPIDSWNVKQLRKLFAYVPQEPMLFNDSIYNNITFGNEKATMEDVMNIVSLLDMKQFLLTCPQGLQTKVGNQGSELSGGQRQCIAIARALISDAPVLILDEATSALDKRNQVAFSSVMKKLCTFKTIICVTHDVYSLSFVDRTIDISKKQES